MIKLKDFSGCNRTYFCSNVFFTGAGPQTLAGPGNSGSPPHTEERITAIPICKAMRIARHNYLRKKVMFVSVSDPDLDPDPH